MFCPRCGKQVSDDALYCPACGSNVSAAAGEGPPPGTSPPTPGPPETAPPPGTAAPPAVVTPPPPSIPKKGKGLKTVLIVAGVILVLVVGALVVLGLFFFNTVKAPVDVTNRYIEAVNEGRVEEAWDLLHPNSPLKREYDLRSFRDLVMENKGSLQGWNAHEVNISGSSAVVTVDMDFEDGDSSTLEFELRKKGDDWLVYSYDFV